MANDMAFFLGRMKETQSPLFDFLVTLIQFAIPNGKTSPEYIGMIE